MKIKNSLKTKDDFVQYKFLNTPININKSESESLLLLKSEQSESDLLSKSPKDNNNCSYIRNKIQNKKTNESVSVINNKDKNNNNDENNNNYNINTDSSVTIIVAEQT